MAADPFYDSSSQITPRGNRHQHPASPGGPLIIHQPRPYDLLLRELDTLKSRLGQIDDELQSTVAELRQSHRQVEKDAGIITSLQEKIMELEDLIGKQKMTIANQSRAISDPNLSLRNRRSFAPANISTVAAQQYAVHETAYEGLPSSAGSRLMNMFESPSYAGYNASMPGGWPVGSHSPMPLMGPQPPIEPYPMYPYGIPVRPSSRASIPTTPSATTSYAAFDYETRVTEFGARFQAIWVKTEVFARTFVSQPSLGADNEKKPEPKGPIWHGSDARIASILLNSPTTRPLYLAKMVNFLIVRDVMKYTAVIKGYDNIIDNEMMKIKGQMASDIPASVRHMMLQAASNQVTRLKCVPGFSDFCTRLRKSHTKSIWEDTKFLIHGNVADVACPAGHALEELVAEVHNLAVDYYSTPYDLRFHFPECGERFDPGQMVNIDPWGIGHASGSFRGQPKVKMSITPVTRIGDNSLIPPRLRVVNSAQVIMRVPDRQWNKGPSPESGRTPKKTAPHSAKNAEVKDASDETE